ncbi:MAG TPA: hypothetical protein VHF02_02075 [Luteimonas sp.]|nr:hypothetical protein [Luteimonas sp.]
MSKVFAWISPAAIAGFVALAAACAPVQAPPVATETAPAAATAAPVAGWYVQDATRTLLQPCGAPEGLTVVNGGELRKRAADFGLQDGEPVYVRVQGGRTAGGFRLARVEQFGSPVPIRDCPMSGTMIQQ